MAENKEYSLEVLDFYDLCKDSLVGKLLKFIYNDASGKMYYVGVLVLLLLISLFVRSKMTQE